MSAQLNYFDCELIEGALYEHYNGAWVRIGSIDGNDIVCYPASKYGERAPKLLWTRQEFLNEFIPVEVE